MLRKTRLNCHLNLTELKGIRLKKFTTDPDVEEKVKKRDVLFSYNSTEFRNRQIINFTLYPKTRKKQKIIQSRTWKRNVKNIKKRLFIASIQTQMIDIFNFLLNNNIYNKSLIINTYIDTYINIDVLVDISSFVDYLIINNKNENEENLSLIFEDLFNFFLNLEDKNNNKINILIQLIDNNIFPTTQFIEKYIKNLILNNPIKYLKLERISDLSKIKIFYKLVEYLFTSKEKVETVEEEQQNILYYTIILTELLENIENVSFEEREKEMIWYEGIQNIISTIETINSPFGIVKEVRELKVDLYKIKDKLKELCESATYKDMFYLDDENKLIITNNDKQTITDSELSKMSSMNYGSFIEDNSHNLLLFAEGLVLNNY